LKIVWTFFIYALIKNFQNLEPATISIISGDPFYSYKYAEAKNFKNIEPQIIEGIGKDFKDSFEYAKKVGFKNIPKPIYDRIKNSSVFPKDATVQESFKRFR